MDHDHVHVGGCLCVLRVGEILVRLRVAVAQACANHRQRLSPTHQETKKVAQQSTVSSVLAAVRAQPEKLLQKAAYCRQLFPMRQSVLHKPGSLVGPSTSIAGDDAECRRSQ